MSPVRPRTAMVVATLVAAFTALLSTGGTAAGSSAAPEPTTAPNRSPAGVDDAYDVVEGESLNVAVLIGVLANDTDPDGDTIEVTGTSQPANGSVSMSPRGSFAYTPDAGFRGVDSFLYEVTDDQGNSTGLVVAVVITVTAASSPNSTDPPNGPPVGVDDAFEVVEGATLDVEIPGLLANDSDPEGDPIRVSLATEPANGDSAVFQVGAFRYTPDPGFVGVDSFLYEVSDDQANATGLVVEVTITVTAAPESTSTTEGTTPAGDSAGPDPGTGPASPTEPTSEATGSTVATDPAPTGPTAADEPPPAAGAADGASAGAAGVPAPSGPLPVTGAESIALGIGALLVVAGSFVTALGSIATHGARRAGRSHHARRR